MAVSVGVRGASIVCSNLMSDTSNWGSSPSTMSSYSGMSDILRNLKKVLKKKNVRYFKQLEKGAKVKKKKHT